MPRLVVTICVRSEASWHASLSPVTSNVWKPSASSRAAMVPRMSSPSQPFTLTTGILMEASSSSMTGNCTWSSSSIFGRWALYPGISAMRNSGLPASKAQMTASGFASSANLQSICTNPNTALVGVPSLANMGVWMAWYALCIRELPSMTAIFFDMMEASSLSGPTTTGIPRRAPSRDAAPIPVRASRARAAHGHPPFWSPRSNRSPIRAARAHPGNRSDPDA